MQSISEAVAEWLPDHIGLEHFANNVTQAYQPGVTTTETLFRYAPCVIGNHPAGADIYATAISITPLVRFTTIYRDLCSGSRTIRASSVTLPSLAGVALMRCRTRRGYMMLRRV